MLQVGILLAVLGAALALRGVLTQRRGSAPHCRGCGFELSGLPEGAGTCPECGRGLSPNGVVVGVRRANRRLVAAGIVVLLLGAGLATLGIANSRFDLNSYKPAWVLALDVERELTGSRSAALAELTARVQSGMLSAGKARGVAGRMLRIQADTSRAWDPTIGDWMELSAAAGLLKPDQTQAYLRTAPVFTFEVRPVIGKDTLWLPNRGSDLGSRGATQRRIELTTKTRSVSVDGETPREVKWGGGFSGPLGTTVAWSLPLQLREFDTAPLAVGKHSIRVELEATLSLYDDPSFSTTMVVPFEASFEVVETSEGLVSAVSNEQLDARMRGAVQNLGTPVFLGKSWGFHGYGWIACGPIPVGMAMDVIWRTESPDREIKAGTMTARASDAPQRISYYGSNLPADLRPGRVRVILRPNVDVAMRTTDLTRIWGGEVDLGYVELRESTDGTIPQPSMPRTGP